MFSNATAIIQKLISNGSTKGPLKKNFITVTDLSTNTFNKIITN